MICVVRYVLEDIRQDQVADSALYIQESPKPNGKSIGSLWKPPLSTTDVTCSRSQPNSGSGLEATNRRGSKLARAAERLPWVWGRQQSYPAVNDLPALLPYSFPQQPRPCVNWRAASPTIHGMRKGNRVIKVFPQIVRCPGKV